MYKDDLAILTSLQHYKDFIKNIKKNLEKQKKIKQKEEEKEYLRKGQQPKIVVMNETAHSNVIVRTDNVVMMNNDRF